MATTPSSMFALRFHSTEGGVAKNLVLAHDVPLPSTAASASSTIVRVLRVSLNPEDYAVAESPMRRIVMSLPAIPATDFAGIILKTSLPGFETGDVVFGWSGIPGTYGALAEYVVLKGDVGLAKVPQDKVADLDSFACLGVAGWTALDSLKEFRNGDNSEKAIFINGGSGGVGTFAIQIAKRVLGVKTVIASCSSSNVGLLKELGADVVVDYTKEDVVSSLSGWCEQNGRKLDAVIDNVGRDPNLFWQSHRYVNPSGKFIQVGVPATLGLGFAFGILKMKLWPKVFNSGLPATRIVAVDMDNKSLQELGAWLAEGKIRVVFDSTVDFALETVKGAFEKLKSRRAKGKIVVKVAEQK